MSSLEEVSEQLQGNQQPTESTTAVHTDAIQKMHQQSQLVVAQNHRSEQMALTQQQLIDARRTDGELVVAQMQKLPMDQTERLGNQAGNTDDLEITIGKCEEEIGRGWPIHAYHVRKKWKWNRHIQRLAPNTFVRAQSADEYSMELILASQF